ncbi:4-(cytidine 5'-diphospho)-2-C-methyl-D-erythritol kinase [Roseococcus sp. DSY-14]|uniref:4-(cytidine 5'-diphospho)-2-C-methyl-D-erythritol kinase n=1 Tax=Roseococcus sp. DSY-14 TaxID=3369650 RepID=UPI00387AE165
MSLREAAPAKVNLFLHVTGRRDDGYHLLDSLVAFGPAADELRGAPGGGLTLTVEGPFAAALAPEPDNLVLRAARALAAHAGVPARAALTLVKRLPVASGIGGGSADAAAALRLLDRAWGLATPPAALHALALRLGADIPVCLAARPARMQGVGEVVRPAPRLPPCALLLANPGVALPTPEVFRARTGPFSPEAVLPDSWPDAAAMAAALAALRNDLEAPAIALRPVVADVISAIAAQPGCLLARMSGSGATCFGLFATAAAAKAAAAALPDAWWTAAGPLYEATAG